MPHRDISALQPVFWGNICPEYYIFNSSAIREKLGIRFEFLRVKQVMAQDLHLGFIREKIYRLRTAVMYSMSDSIFRLPNDIVTAMKVDDEGQLWFICRAYFPESEQHERSFPVRLRFYRKGVDFYIEVSGKATIVNTDYPGANKVRDKKDSAKDQKFFLIKMSMINIEYTEPHAKKPKSKLESFLESGYKWFLRTAAYKSQSASVLAKLHQTNLYGNNPTYHS
jgi:hypothetical protein